ncbi:MAG: response regulator [Burkholderiales bacterium]|nr:response regulator [Burkholderiales bacterium]
MHRDAQLAQLAIRAATEYDLPMTDSDPKALIFVFDDNEAIRTLVRIHLQQAGYEVRVFEDAVEGGQAMLESPPDLLICDVNMPYMDGLAFLGAMKTDPRVAKVPAIMLTSRTDEETEMAAANAGAARFLTKPLRRDDLLQAVQQVLSRSRIGGVLPGRD